MTKIAIIGAGSTVFVKSLLGDIFLSSVPGKIDIRLMDIDPARLETSKRMAQVLARSTSRDASILATQDRSEALEGADFVIVLIQVGGYRPATVIDFEIPDAMGLRQTIGDTLGVGGILRAWRTAPVLVDIARDMARLCPGALMLQYVNPMAINCWVLNRLVPEVQVVGLCHSVQKTSQMLADHLGENIRDIRYSCGGINHMAFYTRFEKREADGHYSDLYPRLHQVTPPEDELVRYEILNRFDYFVTESSEHFAEYVPWFIKRDRPDLIEKFAIPLNEYPRRCEEQIKRWASMEQDIQSATQFDVVRSEEYAADIIEGMVTGVPKVIYGNVANKGYIPNLPEGCCVEVPCVADATGLTPLHFGELPPHLAALIMTNIAPQICAVDAIASNNPEQLRRAIALDPHSGAELTLDEVWDLSEALLARHDAQMYGKTSTS
jgi:alpha-galactosidase